MYDFERMDRRLIVFGNLFRVANRLQAVMDARMEGLTAKQWFVLLMFGMFDGPPTLKELAAACDSSHQNVKQIIVKLQEKGFVNVEKDIDDARAMRITVTPKYDEWEEANRAAAAGFVDAMFFGMPDGEIACLSESLQKIYGRLGEI